MTPSDEFCNLLNCLDNIAKNCSTIDELGIVYSLYAALMSKCKLSHRALKEDRDRAYQVIGVVGGSISDAEERLKDTYW